VWFKAAEGVGTARAAGNDGGQNHPSPQVGVASLPYDPFTPFLLDDTSIRVVGSTALPTGNRQSIKQTEWTYGLMMHMSSSLGVNCTYCHNSRSFQSWDMSTPQRETSWYGIRMVRDLNNDYLLPLESRFPQHRLGPTGDVAKIGCGTCHQGAYKPLYGQSMLATHPELVGSAVQTTLVAPPGALPKAAAADRSVTLLFASGSAELPADGLRELNALVEAARSEAQGKLVISGFHSASGAQDVNEALAKQRALAVRDALVAAGIGEERLVLQKPAVTEANVGGEDTQARRVEVSLSMQ
jgi:photosynthetic reaction center cytochrome c subunit